MGEQKDLLTTNRKALTINLDEPRYGTFAEIGAGQEVARVFFQAGGASGTIAKTISAYDMTFSDAIYGKAPRYVSRERLGLMLRYEYDLLLERLAAQRGDRSTFFVFADTVSARNFSGTNESHGWVGIRFQTRPHAAPSEIIMHVRMWDKENVLQQQALGIAGTNLIYGACYYHADPQRLIGSLVDNLGTERLEIDMLEFRGPDFAGVDNRLTSLHLVRTGLTNAVMFGPRGSVLHPSEVLHKKPILVERGSFRPVTLVNVDMLECATRQFMAEPAVQGREVVVLVELTMHNLLRDGELAPEDFLARVDLLGEIGYTVVISNYAEFYRLTSYFRRYTKEMIGVVLGINNLVEIFNERHYVDLEGGILESFGRLFRHAVRLYVYPMLRDHLVRRLQPAPAAAGPSGAALCTADDVPIAPALRHLYAHLRDNRYVVPLEAHKPEVLAILAGDVLARIRAGDESWATMVPPAVARRIRERKLFGWQPAGNADDKQSST